jgi:glycogen synthase
MADAIRYALDTYYNKDAMEGLIRNAMSIDSSCEHWAFEYAKVYLGML